MKEKIKEEVCDKHLTENGIILNFKGAIADTIQKTAKATIGITNDTIDYWIKRIKKIPISKGHTAHQKSSQINLLQTVGRELRKELKEKMGRE